jgi:amino acid transporter
MDPSQARDAASGTPNLVRRFGLLDATALNMANMVGVGPFLTIPAMTLALGGPLSLLGWVVGAVIVLCDGLVWSELGAALPGSGGSYHFLRQVYGPEKWGRMMAFLFIWQFVVSGPFEIASGMIGFGQYAGYVWSGLGAAGEKGIAALSGGLAVLLLSRRSDFMGAVTVTLWVGTVGAMVAVLACGIPHVEASRVLHGLGGVPLFSRGFAMGLGTASLFAVYNYMGYYDVCYIGDEVKDPARVIPRSIFIAIICCAVGYVGIHVVILGIMPLGDITASHHVVSELIERLYGRGLALVVTALILWTAFASVFALLLGYSRVLYAAALDRQFFAPFARVHPTRHFPDISLYVLGGVSIVAAFFPLETVITVLMTTRVIVQFGAQIWGVELLRRKLPEGERPYKMPFHPLPGIVAAVGWAYLFVSAGFWSALAGLVALVLGVCAFLVWSRRGRTWPFPAGILGSGAVAE